MLASFDEMVLRCLDENSRSHIREAVRCYDAGAYRSAIVAAYIAVCFDLIEKLRSLAAAGDAEAKSRLAGLEALQERHRKGDNAAISGLLAFEKELPTIFRDKFEFFCSIEYDDISRLYVDRNRCAHPTFLYTDEPYRPSAEVSRLHIRNAIDLVLSQEPKQGKAALDGLRATITSEYFPTDDEEVRNRLEKSPLKNGRDALIRAFVDDALFGVATKDHAYFGKFSAVRAVEAAISMRPDVAGARAIINVGKLLQSPDDIAVKYGAIFALRSPEIARALGADSKAVLRAYIVKPRGLVKVSALSMALKIAYLRDIARAEIEKLPPEELRKTGHPSGQEFVERAVAAILNAKSYDSANTAINSTLHIVKQFSAEQIEKILIAASEGSADLVGAFSFDTLLNTIANENALGRKGLQALLEKHKLEVPNWTTDEIL